MNTLKKIIFVALILPATSAYCQCPLVPAACTGTAISGSSNVTIPAATTYYVATATTLSGNVAFAAGTSVLCIEGTWTGALSSTSPPAGATINLYGTFNSSVSFDIAGGGINVNVFPGAKFISKGLQIFGGTNNFMICDSMILPTGTLLISSGTNSITNYGTITLKSGGIQFNAGTNSINNYGTIKLLSGKLETKAGTTINNDATGAILIKGNGSTMTGGTYTNAGSTCSTGGFDPSGGTFTNNSCFSVNSFNISGVVSFTNNSAMNIFGNFSTAGACTVNNNGTIKVFGNFTNAHPCTFTNNGTVTIIGKFTNSSQYLNLADKSQFTSANWENSGIIIGPASGCGSFIATGNTTNSGTVSAANSSRVDIYDTGLPSAKGTPAFPFDGNTGNVNAATATGACATNSFGFADCRVTCSVLLPIELLMFTAQPAGKQVVLNWSTATETNNDYFTIERSAPDGIFKPIGTVKGAGNSSKTLTYTFYDELPLSGISYYRLKQTDYDGQYSYSVIAAVNCDASPYSIIYPNPSKNGQVTINLSGEIGSEILIMIYNSLGEMVYAKTSVINTSSSQSLTTINTESKLAPGIYCVTVADKYKVFNKMLVVSE